MPSTKAVKTHMPKAVKIMLDPSILIPTPLQRTSVTINGKIVMQQIPTSILLHHDVAAGTQDGIKYNVKELLSGILQENK